MTTVTVQALQKLQQMSWEGTHEDESLRHLGKTDIKGVDMTGWGILF